MLSLDGADQRRIAQFILIDKTLFSQMNQILKFSSLRIIQRSTI